MLPHVPKKTASAGFAALRLPFGLPFGRGGVWWPEKPILDRLRNRIEGHICICFTAYTIMLELERRLKKAKASFSLNKAKELTKNIYSITYTLPETKEERTTVLQMSEEQKLLVTLAQN